jgi:DNA replication initiation complex subunit (GINS family)
MMKKEDSYSFENISQIRQKERGKTLSKLPTDFYEKFSDHLKEKKERLQKEYSKNPTALSTMMYADEIRKEQLIFEEIYKRRRRKILLAAITESVENATFGQELLPIERELYNEFCTVIRKNKTTIDAIDEKEGGAPIVVVQEIKAPEAKAPEPVKSPTKPERGIQEHKASEIEETASQQEYRMIRVLEDIDSFMTAQQSYKLRKEDILELPAQIADLLMKNKKAEIIIQ